MIEAREPNGEHVVYEIERPEGEPMGVELEPPTIRRCANRCEFCFIEGLPAGLRKNLYVRDDDYRLSFAYGDLRVLWEVDLEVPLIVRKDATIGDVCDVLHRSIRPNFRYAIIWGKSAKFPGQTVGLDHVLLDGDILSIIKKRGGS